MSEKGVTAGFKSAKKQGCKVVVIDLDEHVNHLDSFTLSKYISRYQTRIEIEHKIETLRP